MSVENAAEAHGVERDAKDRRSDAVTAQLLVMVRDLQAKSSPVSSEDWAAHLLREVAQNTILREHTVQLRKFELALFGDAEVPETVRISLMSTMTRLNTWLDMIGRASKLGGAAVVGFASIAYALHALGVFS